MTGRPEKAIIGSLAAWVSGESAAAVQLVVDELCPAFASSCTVLSTTDISAAPKFKLITNSLIYGSVELVSEATALALRCGLPRGSVAQFLEVMAPGTFITG